MNLADFVVAPKNPADGRMQVVESQRSPQDAWAVASGPQGAFHPDERPEVRVDRVGTAAALWGYGTTK